MNLNAKIISKIKQAALLHDVFLLSRKKSQANARTAEKKPKPGFISARVIEVLYI